MLQLRDAVRAAPSDALLASLVGASAKGTPQELQAPTASESSASLTPVVHGRDERQAPPQHPQARPASSASDAATALRRAGIAASSLPSAEKTPSGPVPFNAVEPDLQWYEGHLFYARKVSSFFVNPQGFLSRAKVFNGQFASETQELKDRIERRETPKSMSAFHNCLFPKITATGLILAADVLEFFRSSVPPIQLPSAEESLAKFVFTRCGPVMDDAYVSYVGATAALESLLTGNDRDEVLRRCFQLCDPGHTGYILKSTLRSLPATELAATEGASSASFVNPELNYIIAQALWRAFGRIAKQEEEKAASAKGKGKGGKKGGKKGGGAVAVGGMRQFHINYHEFVTTMDEDPYVASSFFPFIIKMIPTLQSQQKK